MSNIKKAVYWAGAVLVAPIIIEGAMELTKFGMSSLYVLKNRREIKKAKKEGRIVEIDGMYYTVVVEDVSEEV